MVPTVKEHSWPFRVMARLLDRVGHPLVGMIGVALLGYGFMVLVLSGLIHVDSAFENAIQAGGAQWLVVFAIPWILISVGVLAWSMWRTRHAPHRRRDWLRFAAWVVLALVAAGLIMEVSAISWGIMEGRTCPYQANDETWRACLETAAADAHAPSVLHAVAALVLMVTVPLAPALALHRIRMRSIARDAEGPITRAAHSFQIVRLGGTYLVGVGVFALLFQSIVVWGVVSDLVASARGYSFEWMLGYLLDPTAGGVVVELVWIPIAVLGPLLGFVLLGQASLMRLAQLQRLEAGDRERFQGLIGRDALANALDGNWAGFWIAVGTILALLFLVVAPGVSVILVGECHDCESFVHTVWPLLAILNVVIVAACALLLAAALALAGRALRGRRLREAALAPSQRLESLYAGGSMTRKQFEENRSLADAFARNAPPGERQHTAGRFLSFLLPCWVMALVIWLLIAFLAAFDTEGASSEHLTAFYVEVAVVVAPVTILLVAFMAAGWGMSALGKQETRESFMEFQERTEQFLHEANKRKVRA